MQKRARILLVLMTIALLSIGVNGTESESTVLRVPNQNSLDMPAVGRIIEPITKPAAITPTLRFVPKERARPNRAPEQRPRIDLTVQPPVQPTLTPARPTRIPTTDAVKQVPLTPATLEPARPAASPDQPTPQIEPTTAPVATPPAAPTVNAPPRFRSLDDICGYCGYDAHTCKKFKRHVHRQGLTDAKLSSFL